MPNHVRTVLVPLAPEAPTDALAFAHRRFTWLVNRGYGWQGDLTMRAYREGGAAG